MRVSVIFETKAIMPAGSPATWNLPYLNLVALGNSTLTPHQLLEKLKQIEKKLGRDFDAPRWAPRLIDLDILAWGQEVVSHEELTIPHRELTNRSFFLTLIATLQSNWRYPVRGCHYSHRTLDDILHSDFKSNCDGVKCFLTTPHLVGIVNITPDSFSDGGYHFSPESAIARIKELSLQGAAVIDIGAQSTRPNATPLSPDEEWKRLQPVFEFLATDFASWHAKPSISLDSYNLAVIKKARDLYPIDWINDVQGNEDPSFLNFVAESKGKIVINHSLGIPPASQRVLLFDINPIQAIYEWAKGKIERLSAYGISKDRMIVDPGIGFGKSSFQSLSLLREIGSLKELGCEVLVGHSRKSFMNQFTSKHTSERDLETIGFAHHLCKQEIDYLRVHNVEGHHRSLTAEGLMR